MVSATTKVINPQGTEIEIQCEGEQEKEALAKAVALVDAGLGDM